MRLNELEEENARLRLQVSRDELTGVYSRFGFSETAKYLISSLEEKQKRSDERRLSHVNNDDVEHLALLFIDLDDFKPINDTLGHEVGDKLLISFAKLLQTQVRHADIVGRLGGDEFVILLTEDDLSSGKKVAKKIQKLIKDFVFHLDGKEVSVGVSCGVSSTSEGLYCLEKLLRQADLRMYKDKELNK
jgi:diguanylate cyclase (GGDEF)-like protein